MHIPILYQDADIIVVNKPTGVSTHAPDPADPYPGDALRAVRAQTGLAYLGMHQRLDAETSGVLLFAARREANRGLAEAFEGRQTRKVYLALVDGRPPAGEGMIDAPIRRDRDGRYRVAAPGDREAQDARTRYRVIRTAAKTDLSATSVSQTGSPGLGSEANRRGSVTSRLVRRTPLDDVSQQGVYSLLEVIPETGRPHQIRVHLAQIGAPVVGDPLYGSSVQAAPRLCLHAHELSVPHPTTGQEMTFTASPPEFFDRLSTGFPELALARSGLHVRDAVVHEPTALRALLQLAVERRAPLAAEPTTAIYRLVNGAADGLPGLSADRFGEALVIGLYDDEGSLPPASCPASLAVDLTEISGARAVYVKYRPKQASHVSEDQLGALAPVGPLLGPEIEELTAQEDGLAYRIRPGDGLSVGLFPDMREGRGRVRAWAAGRRVLNCFAYTCGFGVAAMAGGAARVLNLDVSKPALEWGRANYRANGFEPDSYDFVYGDVFDWLTRLARHGDRFDLVILDPPGFSKTKSRRFSAGRDYGELAALAASVTTPKGLLVACCNVAELSWRSFRDRVLAGLASAGRPAEVAGVYHEPQVDFPVLPGQEPYLKMLVVRLA